MSNFEASDILLEYSMFKKSDDHNVLNHIGYMQINLFEVLPNVKEDSSNESLSHEWGKQISDEFGEGFADDWASN